MNEDWIDCGYELPTCEGSYFISNDNTPTAYFIGIAEYDGVGFLVEHAYRKPKFWKKIKGIEKNMEELKISEPQKIEFFCDGKWIIRFSERKGIEFNRESFPIWKPDDFCLEFVNLMEKNFNIKFIKKEIHE